MTITFKRIGALVMSFTLFGKAKAYYKSHRSSAMVSLVTVLVVFAVGSYLLFTKAATSVVSTQAEAGTASANARVVTDTTASGGKAVKFTAPAAPSALDCPAYPAFPDANCTGWQHTGVTLTAYTGPYTIDVDGTVIDGKDINDCLYISANNVTIKNSRIRCAGSGPQDAGNMIIKFSNYYTPSTSGLTLTDDEITRPPGSNGGVDYAVQLYGQNVTMTRVNIYNVTSGIGLGGSTNVKVQDSYIHDMVNISGTDHNDGIMSNGGIDYAYLLHNRIEVPISETTPIAMYADLNGPNNYWTIDKNILAGGGYCIYPSYSKGSEQPNTHITVTNNHFSRKFFPNCGDGGPVDYGTNGASFYDGAGNTWSGNVWDDTGQPVTP